jgi:transcriptional regulator with XRE-family HTH domain
MAKAKGQPGADRMGIAIREARLGARLNQTELARKVKVEQSHLSRWELGKSLPGLAYVATIENVLSLHRGALLIQAGYVDLHGVSETERAIEVDPMLSDSVRSGLLAMYRAVRKSNDG